MRTSQVFRRSAVSLAVTASMAVTACWGASAAVQKVRDLVIYEDVRFHAAFPSVVKRRDGSLLVAFRRAPDRIALGETKNLHVDANSQLMSTTSPDGETWSAEPSLLYADPVAGSQDPCLLALRDGTLLCPSYGWTEIRPEGLPNLIRPAIMHEGGFVFMGGYVLRSGDDGASWRRLTYPPSVPGEFAHDAYGRIVPAYNRGALSEGPDGKIYWVVARHDQEEPARTSTHLLTSSDRGATWTYSAPVAADTAVSFNEASAYLTPRGNVIAFLRTAGLDDHACMARSTDGGRTFGPWLDLGFQGHPLHALRLPDQRVLLTYGFRHAPYGIRARILNAECTDARTATEIILRDDGATTDLGYPWAVQLDRNRVLVVYYMSVAGRPPHIAGTILAIER